MSTKPDKPEKPEGEANRFLVKRLSDIMEGLDRVPKRGRNEFHKYDYVMEADLVDAVRQDLAKAGIMVFPQVLVNSVQWMDTVNKDGVPNGKIYSATFMFTFTDGEFSETCVVPGCGHDNPGDKAPYKAMTGALKYAIMKTFLIPTGDDPEDEREVVTPQRSGRDRDPVPATTKTPDAPAPSRSGPTGSGGGGSSTIIPFGKDKGKTLAEVDDAGLLWITKAFEDAVDKNDPKWHAKNLEKLAAAKAEWAKRQPWRDVWNKSVAFAAKYEIGEAGLIDLMKEATGKAHASELVADDLNKIEAAIIKKGS